jgi:hypothetical protein
VMNLLLPWWICFCRDEFALAVAHVGHRIYKRILYIHDFSIF